MPTERYEALKALLKVKLSCTATYGRTGVSHNGLRKVCLQHIIHEGKEIADHLWVELENNPRLGGHETVAFDLELIKRKRPGATFMDKPVLDVQARTPVIMRVVKR